MSKLVRAVQAAGVVGAGGGGFPTHVKLAARVDTVIANGVECEPLVYSDRQLLAADPESVLRGLRLAMAATGASRGIVAVKEEAQQALRALAAALGAGDGIELATVGNHYPAGDEFVLVQSLTARSVPEGGLPLEVGVLVHNVATLSQVAAAQDGEPVTWRYLTVSGEVGRPCTLRVPLGTPVRQVLAWAGGTTRPLEELAVVAGGAMMGRLVGHEAPTTKTMGALLVLPQRSPVVQMLARSLPVILRRGRSACDQCRDCTDLCPRYLLGHALRPHEIMRSINYGLDGPTAVVTAAVLCSECRLCEAYACPLELSPMAYYRACKAELRRLGWQNDVHRRMGLTPLAEQTHRRVPVHRLIDRLGLATYAGRPLVADESEQRPESVHILLRQHAGAAAVPVVRQGQRVRRGDVVGEIPQGQLGARVHASIDGVVAGLAAEAVTIRGE